MRAVTVSSFGAPAELTATDRPAPGRDELLVRVEAAALNPVDRRIANGDLRVRLPHRFPLVPGTDGAGVVVGMGSRVTGFRIGQRVAGRFDTPPLGRGCFAEYAVISAHGLVAAIPDGLSAHIAAAVPVAGTAAHCLSQWVGTEGRKTVLIVGAAGGVGSFLVQLAALHGGYVIATARRQDVERLRALGAAEVVEYTESVVLDQVTAGYPDGVDVLIDLVGTPAQFRVFARTVRPGGVALSTTASADATHLHRLDLEGGNFQNTASAGDLAELLRDIAGKRITAPIEHAVRLDDVPALLGRVRGGRGKTIVTI
ncbi:NADP-dependent oxidoreductase [Nocardia arthritidis]|nr:NADP-dependent oxidoreductase [Nocardia arthritidis]